MFIRFAGDDLALYRVALGRQFNQAFRYWDAGVNQTASSPDFKQDAAIRTLVVD